jgi:hypothetical protein
MSLACFEYNRPSLSVWSMIFRYLQLLRHMPEKVIGQHQCHHDLCHGHNSGRNCRVVPAHKPDPTAGLYFIITPASAPGGHHGAGGDLCSLALGQAAHARELALGHAADQAQADGPVLPGHKGVLRLHGKAIHEGASESRNIQRGLYAQEDFLQFLKSASLFCPDPFDLFEYPDACIGVRRRRLTQAIGGRKG